MLYQLTMCLVNFVYRSKLSLMLTKMRRVIKVQNINRMGQSTLQIWYIAESGLATTENTQNLCKSTFVFSCITLVVSRSRDNCYFFRKKKRDSGKRGKNDGMRDSHKVRAGMRDQNPPSRPCPQRSRADGGGERKF